MTVGQGGGNVVVVVVVVHVDTTLSPYLFLSPFPDTQHPQAFLPHYPSPLTLHNPMIVVLVHVFLQ